MTLRLSLLAVLGCLLIAGCGSTKIVTKVIRPCLSSSQMSKCMTEIVNASRTYEKLSLAQVSCRQEAGDRYGCVAKIDGGCYKALVERTQSGAASFLSTALEKPARCEALFPSS
jgi:hypothetical protein